MFIDKHLSFDYHINQLSNKLSRSIGILFKLRNFTTKDILISVYNSIFYSHILYGCPVWSLTSKKNLNMISVLQKKAIRTIHFATYNSHTNDYFRNDKILKLDDIIKIEQLKLVYDFKNNKLPDDLSDLFKLNDQTDSLPTRNITNSGLYISKIRTTSFGINSLKYSASVEWNNLLQTDKKLNMFKNRYSLSNYLKKHFFIILLITRNIHCFH